MSTEIYRASTLKRIRRTGDQTGQLDAQILAVLKEDHHTRKPFGFKRALLPSPAEYFKAQGLKLTGGGEWRNAVCPFHDDTHPSLRVRLDTGGFRCMVCGAHGGDVLAFHRLITGLPFIRAAKDLGAWEEQP